MSPNAPLPIVHAPLALRRLATMACDVMACSPTSKSHDGRAVPETCTPTRPDIVLTAAEMLRKNLPRAERMGATHVASLPLPRDLLTWAAVPARVQNR
jgi:hypothetical protein